MGWLSIVVQVIPMIFKYGPKLWDLGCQVYEMVEEIIEDWKSKNPGATATERKETKDKLFEDEVSLKASTAGIAVNDTTARQLRRDVWATRKDNYKKVKKGKTKVGKAR